MDHRLLILMLLVLSVVPLSTAEAQKKLTAAQKDERRENEAVRKAQQDVKAAQEAENAAEKSAKKAYDDVKSGERSLTLAGSQLQKVRDDLEARHAAATGLVATRKALEAARQHYETAGQPVLQRLAATAEYKEAVDAAKAAEMTLARLRAADGESDAKRKQLAEAARIKQVPSQLQRAALDAEPSLEPERVKLAAATEAVAAARKATDAAIEKDPALKAANDKIEDAKKDLAEFRRTAAQEERQLIAARQKLAREQQDLQQKIAADKRDDNKPNKNKK